MFNGSILVATDGTALSEKAIAVAVELARATG
jgi:nucleotide-binding universal stress UspA family protein